MHAIGPLTEEQTLLLDTIRKFAQDEVAPGAGERDLERAFPSELIEGIAELGLLGVPYPESAGGVELGHLTHTLVLEELSHACGSTAMTVLAHTNLALGAVFHGGNAEQHENWGAPLAAGEPLGALVIGAGEIVPGPALGGVTATKGDNCWILNGTVDCVLNGSRSGLLVVLAATNPDTAATGLFVVDGGAEGLVRGEPIHTMGLRSADHAAVTFKDVKVPEANVLGDPEHGADIVENVLDRSRVALAAVNVGLARAALDKAITFGKERIAFGRPIAAFDGSLEKYANMSAALEGARQMVFAAARAQDDDVEDFACLAVQTQILVARVVLEIGFEAVQLMGGYGYCHEYDTERICRDAKMCEVGFDELAFARRRLAKRVVGL